MAAGSSMIDPGMANPPQMQPMVIITVASHLAFSGTARRMRQLTTRGPKRGCASNHASQRADPRAKQKAASNTNGVVGSNGRKMPTMPAESERNPATSHSPFWVLCQWDGLSADAVPGGACA